MEVPGFPEDGEQLAAVAAPTARMKVHTTVAASLPRPFPRQFVIKRTESLLNRSTGEPRLERYALSKCLPMQGFSQCRVTGE
jgi:hypothetical protein